MHVPHVFCLQIVQAFHFLASIELRLSFLLLLLLLLLAAAAAKLVDLFPHNLAYKIAQSRIMKSSPKIVQSMVIPAPHPSPTAHKYFCVSSLSTHMSDSCSIRMKNAK